MLKLTKVLGNAAEPAVADRLHHLGHHGRIEYVTLRSEDVARRRLRVHTDRGTEIAIALDRADRLENGAVLSLDGERAVLVRLETPRWLGLRPRDAAAGLEVGYAVGNMHWQVRFSGGVIWVRLDGDASVYRARIADLLSDGRADVVEAAA
jgi:urease accessory protein